MMRRAIHAVCVVAVIIGSVAAAWAEDPYQVAWTAQIGTTGGDTSRSVAVDASGNAYISGSTYGGFDGPSAGSTDGFLSKFDSDGNALWTTQFGTNRYDCSQSVALDASGNAYVTGFTEGHLDGTNAGQEDAFLIKFDSGGNKLWTTQFGSNRTDMSHSVAVDRWDNVYINGYTEGDLAGSSGDYDGFLSKFNSSGSKLWTTQFGTIRSDQSVSVAADASGNVYVSGSTYGDLGGSNEGDRDVFLSKFDSGGNGLWTTQFGTSRWDVSASVVVDASGNVYISGDTYGGLDGLNAGDHDAFLSRFDSDGNKLWTTQIGSNADDRSCSVAVDALGNAYITGYTEGDLDGPNAGDYDGFLHKFDSDGNEIWTTQFGTSDRDHSRSVAVDASGNVYISGSTNGDLGGPNAGGGDAFLVKYEVPEPATLSLMVLGGLGVLRRRRRK